MLKKKSKDLQVIQSIQNTTMFSLTYKKIQIRRQMGSKLVIAFKMN